MSSGKESLEARQARAAFDAQIDKVKQLATLAKEMKCEISIGEISVRPTARDSLPDPKPAIDLRCLLGWLRMFPMAAVVEQLDGYLHTKA